MEIAPRSLARALGKCWSGLFLTAQDEQVEALASTGSQEVVGASPIASTEKSWSGLLILSPRFVQQDIAPSGAVEVFDFAGIEL